MVVEDVVRIVCYLLALICFAVAATGRGNLARSGRLAQVGLVPLGLAFYMVPALLGTIE